MAGAASRCDGFVEFENLLRQCHAKVHDQFDVPVADGSERTARDGNAHDTTSASLLANDTRFIKLRPFTPAHVSCATYGHGPRFCNPADPTQGMGQTVAMGRSGSVRRNGWCQIVQTPGFYNPAKSSRRARTPTFMGAGDTAHRDLSWWRWGHERYSCVKAQQGNVDRLCGSFPSNMSTGIPQVQSHYSVFSSRQPRTVALPTHRTNDSRLANSQWGADHKEHYSGEIVGPGRYNIGTVASSKPYTATLHRHGLENMGLPGTLTRDQTTVKIVKQYAGYTLAPQRTGMSHPGHSANSIRTKAVSRVSCWRHHGKAATQRLTRGNNVPNQA
eukprot:jgi/Ulvmu1/12049/UM083_0062.1